jgi:hydroxymethylpyrimidine pyrophosphatase-like HAD family hydrolase
VTTTPRTAQRTAHRLDLAAPALVACDIDGTLIHTGRPPTDAVLDAIGKVRAAGHHVVLATGRSLVGALHAAEQLGIDDGWIVASNGAVTAHLVGRDYEVTDLHVIEPEPVVRLAQDAMPGLRIATEVVGVGYRVNLAFPVGELPGEQREVTSLSELWSEETPRLALQGFAAYGLAPALRAMGLTAIATRTDWVDVTPPGLSKASALEQVRQGLGVEQYATVAIGDGENDLEMLRWATRSIVMGHAPGHVQGAADGVTGSIDEDGAAAALLSLLG